MSLYKYLTGNEFEDDYPKRSLDSIIDSIQEGAASGYPLRTLGQGTLADVDLSEEARESHIHILGSPGTGKSKFLELLLRQDIDSGYGACLLDPSDNGDTCYKVLKYAILKGHKKIVLIDPHDIAKRDKQGNLLYGYVPCINPIHYTAPLPAVVGNLMDSMRVLWGQGSFTDTPRIQKYLPAVISALYASQMTMAESKWFLERDFDYESRRIKMVDCLDKLDVGRKHLEAVFGSKAAYVFEPFQSTVNRLQPFTDPTIQLILGSKTGLDFRKLVSENYIILVNLTHRGLYSKEHQRLIGTFILGEIDYAMFRLKVNGWNGFYNLYVDECGDYATDNLKEILDKRRKSGMRFALSHQGFDQLPKEIESSVRRGTGIKVLFNTRDREDRDKMIRLMYGGDLSDRDVSYTLGQLKKRNAVIKINTLPPVSFRVDDVPDVDEVSAKDLHAWKEQHYKSNPHLYRHRDEVRGEIKNRFDKASTPGTKPDAPRPDNPVRPDGPATNAPAGGVQNRADNQAPAQQGTPVADQRGNKSVRKNVERQKGIPPSLVRKRKQDDEPVGE